MGMGTDGTRMRLGSLACGWPAILTMWGRSWTGRGGGVSRGPLVPAADAQVGGRGHHEGQLPAAQPDRGCGFPGLGPQPAQTDLRLTLRPGMPVLAAGGVRVWCSRRVGLASWLGRWTGGPAQHNGVRHGVWDTLLVADGWSTVVSYSGGAGGMPPGRPAARWSARRAGRRSRSPRVAGAGTRLGSWSCEGPPVPESRWPSRSP